MDHDTRLLIFARAPVPGQCKTRLTPFINAEQASQLHQKLVTHTLGKFALDPVCQVELCCTPDVDHAFFLQLQLQYDIRLQQQSCGDLGQKMAQAMKQSLETCRRTIIIGTDCPTLSRQHLTDIINQLKTENLASIIPATDGGYVLIGLQQFNAAIFQNINWGTESVMQQTAAQLDQLGWRWQKNQALNDIDRPEDLNRLLATGFRFTD